MPALRYRLPDSCMKILVAPLNWGLGHASRCVPIIRQLVARKQNVTIAGDGMSLRYLRMYFPELPFLEAPSLHLHYSKGNSQIGSMLRQLPTLLRFIRKDHKWIKEVVTRHHFDLVISDNRFGLYTSLTRTVYITHQVMVKMPQGLTFAEKWAYRLHRLFIDQYNYCLIPDYPNSPSLSGDLSHKYPLPHNARFIGPLSRFMHTPSIQPDSTYDVVAIISGLEPHRTMLEQQILQNYAHKTEKVLILEGRIGEQPTSNTSDNIHIVSHMDDKQLLPYLLGCKKIICRSGYSSIMDLAAIHQLHKATLIATPGQTEQEYLAQLHQTQNTSHIEA